MAKLSSAENARLDRLASEVRKGGGMDLPSLFGGLLNELLDNGPANHARMTEITQKVSVNKSKKIDEIWNGSWEFYTRDALEQLESRGYVTHNDDGDIWTITENVPLGEVFEVVPLRKGLNAAFTSSPVWDKETREQINHEAWLKSQVTELIRQPRNRPHSREVVARLREEAATTGLRNPILVDANGRTVDGRHRRDIDPTWPTTPFRRADGQVISTDLEVLTAIDLLDSWKKQEMLSPKDSQRIRTVLGEVTQTSVKRQRIESALREDASRSNRQIAELIGVSPTTVTTVRELMSNLDINPIHRWVFMPAGRGVSTGEHSKACKACNGTEKPTEKPEPKLTQSDQIDKAIRDLFASGYIHVKNVPGRKALCDAVETATGIRRSHGALEQRVAKLGLETKPAPKPVVTQPEPKPEPKPSTPQSEPEPVVPQPEPNSQHVANFTEPEQHQHKWITVCECCGKIQE